MWNHEWMVALLASWSLPAFSSLPIEIGRHNGLEIRAHSLGLQLLPPIAGLIANRFFSSVSVI